MLPLRELQVRLLAAIAAGPAGDGPPPGAGDPVLLGALRGPRDLDPAAGVAIYAGMSRARLLDVLREDFPRVLAVVGDEAFADLAERYLARHPSTHPSVRHLGRRLAAFVASEAAPPPFLGDLARLEWARVEAFDAPDAEPLRLADLRAVAPEAWPGLRLRPVPSCAVVRCAWPAHEVWAAAGEPGEAPIRCAPARTALRVWREGFAVSHAAMGAVEQRAFAALRRGEPFAGICEAAAGAGDPAEAALEVGALLARWTEDGVLAAPAP